MKRLAQHWQSGVIGLLAVCFLSAVGAQAYVGSFSRMMADTYCYAVNVTTNGLWGAQQVWYNTWTGRFSFNLAESLTGWAGPPLIPLLPPLVLFVWFASLVSLIYQLRLSASRAVSIGSAVLCSGLILAITLGNIPLVAQSVYWSSGLTNYIPPLILLPAFASLLVYAGRRATVSRLAGGGRVLCAALLMFVAAGFSEVAAAAQLAALGGLVVALWVYGTAPTRGRGLPLSVAGLLGGALGLAIVVAAPGNSIRATFFLPPPALPALLALAVKLTIGYLQTAWIAHPGNLLAAGLLADSVVMPLSRRGLVRLVLWTPIVVVGLELTAFAVAAYGSLARRRPARRLCPSFFWLLAWLCGVSRLAACYARLGWASFWEMRPISGSWRWRVCWSYSAGAACS